MAPIPDQDTAALLRRFAADFADEPEQPSIAERRAALDRMVALYGLPAPSAVEDREIAGPGGPLRLRIHRRYGPPGRPILVNLHGGGWVLGGPEAYSGAMDAYGAAGDCVVVDVDYRRAPEHLYPAALDDAGAALAWVRTHADALNGDAARIILSGDSAGGYLAARLALASPGALAGLVLVYPVLAVGEGHHLPSREALGDGSFFLAHDVILRAEAEFFAPGTDLDVPLLSPVRADEQDLAGLPPTLLVAAGLDPLRDEARLFADRIGEAGGEVQWECVEATIHAFVLFAGAIGAGRPAIARIGDFIRETVHRKE